MAPLRIDDDDDGKGNNNVCLSSCNRINDIKNISYLQVTQFETRNILFTEFLLPTFFTPS